MLARGTVPCDVLFVGEAPGASEDVIGRPFVGPAGHLLDEIIKNSVGSRYRVALTNLVGCIPRADPKDLQQLKVADKSGKIDPPEEAIRACAPRLREFVRMCRPSLIVCVGKLATKWASTSEDPTGSGCHRVDVVHPAAILRMDVSQKGLAIQRATIAIADALKDI